MNTEVYLVRHGEPLITNSMLGATDSPLSERGWSQLENTFGGLGDIQFDAVISSPLSRCASFAQHYCAEKNLPLAIVEDWKECDFGEWDGKSYQGLHQKYPQALSKFYNDPMFNTPPNGEPLKDFCIRVENALDKTINRFAGKQIAIVTHAGVIRTLVAWCLQMDYASGAQFKRFSVDYASVTHISIYHAKKIFPQLIRLNKNFPAEVFA